ncbi:hypothetical protein [Sphingomonas mesophila]|uniref:hypothetical protein n=1 Tax=Sphingomonas mesophila TaxID=2303576 RepID=UPI0013C36D9B|nr:hypothetical protein [Sphingomonas mesophila]
MAKIISLLIGVVALLCAVVAFIPLLGWANWLIIPLAAVGAGIGLIGRSKSGAALNIFVILIGVMRLSLGGGII